MFGQTLEGQGSTLRALGWMQVLLGIVSWTGGIFADLTGVPNDDIVSRYWAGPVYVAVGLITACFLTFTHNNGSLRLTLLTVCEVCNVLLGGLSFVVLFPLICFSADMCYVGLKRGPTEMAESVLVGITVTHFVCGGLISLITVWVATKFRKTLAVNAHTETVYSVILPFNGDKTDAAASLLDHGFVLKQKY